MSRVWPVLIVDQRELGAWREDPNGGKGVEFAHAKVEATGKTVLCWLDVDFGTKQRFSWVCPSCGGLTGGYLGDAPVSGWENPRWVNSGTRERPTLTPSLGCPGWRSGTCDGHYWLREGVLVPA